MIPDLDSFDLPINSFSFLNNVRAEDDKLSRGPIFSSYQTTSTSPQHLLFYQDSSGTNHTQYVDNIGDIYEIATSGTTTKLSPSGYTGTSSPLQVTDCTLGGVTYVNRSDRTLWYRVQASGGDYALLSTYNSGDTLMQFNASWRFNAVREFNSMVIGLGLTNGANTYPTMVFWSNFQTNASGAAPPPDWDYTSASSSAGQNQLNEMTGEIVDGIKLNGAFLLLGSQEVWSMQISGLETSIFNFQRLFQAGTMSVNCAVEAFNKAYVFGSTDLFVTDGTSYQSIASQKVRRWLFSNLVQSQSAQCFVVHNEPLNEVLFCFPSQDPYCYFPYSATQSGCNRALVWNYASGQWYAYDLPYVTSATFSDILLGLEFVQTTATFDGITGTFASLEDAKNNILTFGSYNFTQPGTTNAISAGLRALDLYGNATTLTVIDTVATAPATITKNAMNFQELEIPLYSQKLVSSMILEGSFTQDSLPVTVEVGGAEDPNSNLVYGNPQTWEPGYAKCDFNVSGKYIGFTMTYPDVKNFDLSAIDIDLSVIGAR